jgi:uncharacterized protein YbaR (Trm112 family)/SAM-dependent methyltransferase
MRRGLLKIMCCPICRQDLELKVNESLYYPFREPEDKVQAIFSKKISTGIKEGTAENSIEEIILSGALTCGSCKVYYPIYKGVPRMLTYPTAVAAQFNSQHATWVKESLEGFQLPSEQPVPGELNVLKSFSTEWLEYEWTDQNYWAFTTQALFRTMDYLLAVNKYPLKGKLVLEVGIGIGGIADNFSRKHGCNVVGIDLGYAVDKAYGLWNRNPRLNIVQASVFALPFKEHTFDVTYSQGVLHHTYDTREAFHCFSRMVKEDAGMAYIWVYSRAKDFSSFARRLKTRIVNIVRPVISRLPQWLQNILLSPQVLAYILFQNYIKPLWKNKDQFARYGWNEALHAARDSFTPPFVNRHSYEDVSQWFSTEGFTNLELLRDDPQPELAWSTFWENVGVRGFKGPKPVANDLESK